jgi:hypothetical protein
MLIAWGIATLGSFIIIFSQNLLTVSIGLFFLGAGSDASINMCFNFLGYKSILLFYNLGLH